MQKYSQTVKQVLKKGNYLLLFKLIPYLLITSFTINGLTFFFNFGLFEKRLLLIKFIHIVILLCGVLYFFHLKNKVLKNILLYEVILALCLPIYHFITLLQDNSVWYLYSAVIFGGLLYGLFSGYFFIPVAVYPLLYHISFQLAVHMLNKDTEDAFKINSGIFIVMWFSAISASAARMGFDIYYHFRSALRDQALELESNRKLKKATEQKLALEMELNRLKSTESSGLNAGGIAHDFNNMLTIIAGQMMSLRRTATDDLEQKSIATIMQAVKKTSGLIKKLLLLTGNYSDHRQVFSLNETIETIVELLRHGSNRNIKIKADITKDIARIHGDSNLFQSLLISFLYNVIKSLEYNSELHVNLSLFNEYNKESPSILKVDSSSFEKIVILSIHCTFIYNQSWQKDSAFIELVSIINAMNGKMITGKDLIQITLPLSKKEVLGAEQQAISVTDNKVILIIDDDIMVLKSTEEVLVNAGYKVIICNDATDALKTFKQKHKEISLVLLDMRMPDKSGKELYFDLKRIDPDLKVIIVSGYCSDIDVQEMLNDGVLAYVEKPYTEDVLCKKVVSYI